MASTSTNEPTFLGLPPELRLNIYEYCTSPSDSIGEIDVTELAQYYPEAVITQTCRQLRNESLQILQAAKRNFARQHTIYYPLHASAPIDSISAAALDIPRCSVRELHIKLVPGRPAVPRVVIRARVEAEGRVRWCILSYPRDGAQLKEARGRMYEAMARAFPDVAIENGIELTVDGGMALHVPGCLRAFTLHMEELYALGRETNALHLLSVGDLREVRERYLASRRGTVGPG